MKDIGKDWTYTRMEDVLDDSAGLEEEETAGIDDIVLVERTAGFYSIDWIPENLAV